MKLTTLLVIGGLLGGLGALAAAEVLPKVTVTSSDTQANETGLRPGVFTFSRTGATTNPLLVVYKVGGTAVNGVDYKELPGRVIIPAGATKASFEVTPIDDPIAEGAETVILNVQPGLPSLSSTPSLYEIGTPAQAGVTIVSSDTETALLPTLDISVRSLVVPEAGPGLITFLLQRFGPGLTRSLRVEYEVLKESLNAEGIDGVPLGNGQVAVRIPAATEVGDYPKFSGVAEFAAGASSVAVSVRPVDDQLVEGTEHVTLRIKPANAYQINAPGRATVFLQDNDTNAIPDRATVSIAATDAAASESGTNPGAFTVTRAGLTNVTLTVLYSVTGTASNGVDYEKLPGSLVIPAGVTSVKVPVVPLADKLAEETETVTVTLQAPVCVAIFPPPPECYLVATSNQATVKIENLGVTTNRPPVVKLVNPENGARFNEPARIELVAQAEDPDGAGIKQVSFLAGGQLLRAITNNPASASPVNPFQFAWTNVAKGEYSLTAVAIDASGLAATSAVTRVVVGVSNSPPSVAITSPTNGAVMVFASGQFNSTVRFTSTDADGRLVRFELLDNGKVVSTRTNVSLIETSFVIAWTNRVNGLHELAVRATDDRGTTTTSAAVRVTTVVPNLPPVVQLAILPQSAPGQGIPGPTNLTLRAMVADPDLDSIRKVEFTVNGKVAGTVERAVSGQHTFVLTNAQPGIYVIFAKATDDRGAVGYSPTSTVVVAPGNGLGQIRANITQPNFDNVVRSNSVTVVAQVTGLRADQLPKVELLVDDEVAGRFQGTNNNNWRLTLTNLTSGAYVLTVRATLPGNVEVYSPSASLRVVLPTLPPVVRVIAPTNGAIFATGADITVSATAEGRSGAVTVVQIYSAPADQPTQRKLLKADDHAPYNVGWNNVPAGSYILTAETTDSLGLKAVSEPVKITVSTANLAPSVSIVSPENEARFDLGARIPITVSTSDRDGYPTLCEVFAGEQKIGSQVLAFIQAPKPGGEYKFEFIWTNAPGTTHSLVARVTDDRGLIGSSRAVKIMVSDKRANQPPQIELTRPSTGDQYPQGTGLKLEAKASDTDGKVAFVEFFATEAVNGGMEKWLGSTKTAPYTFVWENLKAGEYFISAQATDDAGAKTRSRTALIFVNAVEPAPKVTVKATIAEATELVDSKAGQFTITRTGATKTKLNVRYSLSGTAVNGVDYDKLPGIVTIPEGASSVVLKVMPLDDRIAEGVETVVLKLDQLVFITVPAPEDNYVVGEPGSATVTIKDDDAQRFPPKVDITLPATGTKFLAGDPITFAVDAADANGYITRVDLYAGEQRIAFEERHYLVAPKPGEIAHFVLTWANAPAGSHKITAKATDDSGTTAVSAPVAIEVVAKAQTVVSVTTATPEVQESRPQSPGEFKLTRTGPATTKLNVRYTMSGPAVNGVDYETLSGLAVIPAGASSTIVKLVPIPDKAIEGKESAILTVSQLIFAKPPAPEDDYLAGEPKSAVITIYEDAEVPVGTMSTVTVAASTQTVDPGGDGLGFFTLTRTAPFDVDLTVLYSVEGTAVPGVDYVKLPGAVVIPKGSASVLVSVKPLPASLGKAFTTVLLTVQTPACPKIFPPPPECYVAGIKDRATVYILTLPVPPGPPELAAAGAPAAATLVAAETDDEGNIGLLFHGQVGAYYVIEAWDEADGWKVTGLTFSGEGWFSYIVGRLKDATPAEYRARLLAL